MPRRYDLPGMVYRTLRDNDSFGLIMIGRRREKYETLGAGTLVTLQ